MVRVDEGIAAAPGLIHYLVAEDELEGRVLLAGNTKGSDDFYSPLLMGLVIDARDIFTTLVLPKLDTVERMMLARVNKKLLELVVTEGGERATKKEILRVPRFVKSVSLLAWARENGCPWDERTCAAAAATGNLEVLQWARANGCPWDSWTCSLAALGGRLEVLQWARANGCPWDENTCRGAAEGGHLEVLQWARANGCPWDEYTSHVAAQGGHLEVLHWLHANGCPEWPSDSEDESDVDASDTNE